LQALIGVALILPLLLTNPHLPPRGEPWRAYVIGAVVVAFFVSRSMAKWIAKKSANQKPAPANRNNGRAAIPTFVSMAGRKTWPSR